MIELDDGVLHAKIVSDRDVDVSERKWRRALVPAIALLKSAGGGGLCVPHRPGELAP